MHKILLLLFLILAKPGYSENPKIAMAICKTRLALHEAPSLESNISGYLLPGEVVTILDTTAKRFPIGTSDLSCRDFPFIHVQVQDGRIGWASGQYIFRVLDASSGPSKMLVRSRNTFSLGTSSLEIRLARNFGIPTSYQGDLTGCEEYYPVILFEKAINKYSLVELNNSPNSSEKYWNLVSDEGTGEEINSVLESKEGILFKIKCIYQEGSCSYDIKLSKKENVFHGEASNYARKDE